MIEGESDLPMVVDHEPLALPPFEDLCRQHVVQMHRSSAFRQKGVKLIHVDHPRD